MLWDYQNSTPGHEALLPAFSPHGSCCGYSADGFVIHGDRWHEEQQAFFRMCVTAGHIQKKQIWIEVAVQRHEKRREGLLSLKTSVSFVSVAQDILRERHPCPKTKRLRIEASHRISIIQFLNRNLKRSYAEGNCNDINILGVLVRH